MHQMSPGNAVFGMLQDPGLSSFKLCMIGGSQRLSAALSVTTEGFVRIYVPVQIFTPSPRLSWLLHPVARTRIWRSGGSRPAYQSLKLLAYTPAFQPRVILALVASESLLLSLFPSSLSLSLISLCSS